MKNNVHYYFLVICEKQEQQNKVMLNIYIYFLIDTVTGLERNVKELK